MDLVVGIDVFPLADSYSLNDDTMAIKQSTYIVISTLTYKKGVPSAESSRSVRGLGKGVSDKPYPRLCNARRPRLEPGTFRSQAIRLYRLHQARPSACDNPKSL